MRRRTVKSLLIRAMLIALLVVALGVAILFYCRSWTPSRSQYPMQGIAVSADQGAIEWNTVRRRDVDFAYIRATSGSDRTDPRFAVNWAGAREAGLRYGAVHDFSLCRLASDQATLFIATSSNAPSRRSTQGLLAPVFARRPRGFAARAMVRVSPGCAGRR